MFKKEEKITIDYYEEEYKKGEKQSSFAVDDLFGILEGLGDANRKIIVINDIYVDKDLRGFGVGRAVLRALCDKFHDRIIILTAGATVKEYPVEPTDDEFEIILERLGRFYEKCGFRDVNQEIGGYDYKKTYLYINDASKSILEYIERR